MMNQINSTKAVVTAVIFSVSLLGMITRAEAHGGNASATDVHACVKNRNGNTRIVGIDDECRRRETATHWAIIGPTGADGINGADGADGATGSAGADGAVGPVGAAGLAGADGAAGPAGTDGAVGPVGAAGLAGADGAAGPAGTDGTNGTGCSVSQCIEPGEATLTCGTTSVNVPCMVQYAIGDTGPAGGIVFHVTNGGFNGLEAASVDQPNAQWCINFINIVGVDNIASAATSDSHSGAHNTPLIAAVCGLSAAGVAENYVWPNGQTDGFLPNKEELNLLFNQRNVVGGFTFDSHWSSSEGEAGLAWSQSFDDGSQFAVPRIINALKVRAVRAF